MKKNEIIIVVVLFVAALLVIVNRSLRKIEPTDDAKGYWIGVLYDNKPILYFDSGIDDTYSVTGDVGEMVIEVKDNAWHVKQVECPNHVCEQMGWHDIDTLGIPITCVPNNIVIVPKDTIENMELGDE